LPIFLRISLFFFGLNIGLAFFFVNPIFGRNLSPQG
jgi:hypothetical protein